MLEIKCIFNNFFQTVSFAIFRSHLSYALAKVSARSSLKTKSLPVWISYCEES